MAVLCVLDAQLFFTWPSIFDKVQVLIKFLTKIIFNSELILICARSQDESFIPELLLVPVADKFDLEIAGVVLPLVLMHPPINMRLHLKRFLDALKVVVPLVKLFHFLIQIESQSVAPFLD